MEFDNTKKDIEKEIRTSKKKYVFVLTRCANNKQGKFKGFFQGRTKPEFEIITSEKKTRNNKKLYSKRITKECYRSAKKKLNKDIHWWRYHEITPQGPIINGGILPRREGE